MLAINYWWPEPTSALGHALELVTLLLHSLEMRIWSIMLWVNPSGDSHVHFLFILTCLKHVFVTNNLLALANLVMRRCGFQSTRTLTKSYHANSYPSQLRA